MILTPSITHLRRQSATDITPSYRNPTPVFHNQVSATPPYLQHLYPYTQNNNINISNINNTTPLIFDFNLEQFYSNDLSANPFINSDKNRTPHTSTHNLQPMQSDQTALPSNWSLSTGQFTPSSAQNHHRQSSLSSLGSGGPASPFDQHNALPQVILPSDSIAEVYYDGLSNNTDQAYQDFQKTPSQSVSGFLPAQFQHNYNLHSYNAQQENFNQLIAAAHKQGGGDDETMQAPDYGHSGRPSVASTNDSPATPSAGDDFEDHSRKNVTEFRPAPSIPKLDRTMSDIYNDELYSPSFSFTSAPSQPSQNAMRSPMAAPDFLTQRLQAANSQHLSANSQSQQNGPRGRSPFRQGSPLAPASQQSFSSHGPNQIRLGSAAQMREKQKEEAYARALEEHARRASPEQSTPKTISPKDALLEYHETEEDAAKPLFPPQSSQQYPMSKPPTIPHEISEVDDSSSQQSFASMATTRRESSSAYSNSSQATARNGTGFTFPPPSVAGVQVPQQYPFVSQQRASVASTANSTDQRSGSETVDYSQSDASRPANSKADTGTYTCTYHGCTLRFETPAKLQKHKREGHRQSLPLGSGAGANAGSSAGRTDSNSGMTSAALLRNSQAGPHKCERINPSTGKPCNTIFSRPYDLTRHEDTIHNARKQKVRCQLCTEEKTFSRNDALTRHMRVVHPEVEFMGKNRRRV